MTREPRTPARADARPRRTAGLGPAYWRLWSASTSSNLADGVVLAALPLVAATLTDSPALVAGVTVALTAPWLLVALPAGALADRLDRRALMLSATTARALAAMALTVAALLGLDSVWVLVAAAFWLGAAEAVHDTAAQSILPRLVPRDRLSRANGRLQAAELAANQFAGPPLAGLLVTAGVVAAFATPSALWLAAVVLLLLLRGRYRAARPGPTTLRADIVAGLRFLWRHELLRTLAAMVGVYNLASNAVFAVVVLYAVGPGSAMGLSAPGYGVLLALLAAGSVLGAVLAEHVERRLGRARTLVLSLVAGAAPALTLAATSDAVAVGAAFVVGGLGVMLWNVVTVSLRQRITPDDLLGRLNSAYRLVAWGTRPLGALVGGLVAEVLGLRVVFAAAGVAVLLVLVGMIRVSDAAMDAAERGPAGTA